MSLLELFILAVGLSMDAFAVAICKGLACPSVNGKNACLVGLWFGGFQALMPLLGWLLGTGFAACISRFDHWIAFILLAAIGLNMIKESAGGASEEDASLSFRNMLILAVATSIDALAVGVTLAFLEVRILPAISFIGVTTFILSCIGMKAGSLLGNRYKSRAELAGGIILCLLGTKILLEHLGILAF
ncbi:MAG: manganese efflux pump [Oscillospiraceae bacterium]|nr:manganese efflux pump [Oscillospiraceae bacterium]